MYFYDKIIFDDYLESGSDRQSSFLNLLEIDPVKLKEDTVFFEKYEKQIIEQFKIVERDQLVADIMRISKSLNRIYNDSLKLAQNVVGLQKLELPEQRSPAWYAMRETMITASDWATAIGKNPYSTRNKLLLKKLGYEGEQFTGNAATAWGVKYEPVATSIYERRNNKTVIEFGLIPHPTISFLGASPDGITADGTMLEIKCPPKRVITGIPPFYYWVQMQGQLEVCDLELCDFLECKIEEYETAEEYFADIEEGSPLSKANGLELGIVLEFKRKDDSLHFEYSPFGMNMDESNKWTVEMIKENSKNNLMFSKQLYWKLTKISCVPVFRDRDWFKDSVPKLKSFWDEWSFYKKHGYEILLKNKKTKPKKSDNFVEQNLKMYEGFFNGDTEAINMLSSSFDKIFNGYREGVPVRKFAFSNESIQEIDEYFKNLTEDDEEEPNQDFDDDDEIDYVEILRNSRKEKVNFLFSGISAELDDTSDSDKNKSKKIDKKPKKSSRFMFSDE